MSKLMTSLSAALSLGLAACNEGGAERAWQLGRDGVYLVDSAGPAKFVRLEGWQWAAAPYACPPDLATGPQGEAVITSNVAPVLWRVDPKTLAVSMHPLTLDADNDKDVGFSALAYSPEHGAFFGASPQHGSVWRIDAQLTHAQKLPFALAVRGSECPGVPLQITQLSMDQ